MYIVPSRKKNGERTYTYYHLVEGVRTAKGPRHRVILSLGKLPGIPEDQIRLLGRLVHQRLTGAVRLLPAEAEEEQLQVEVERITRLVVSTHGLTDSREQVVSVKLDSIEAGEAVLLGPLYVGVETWKRLQIDKALSECGFSQRQRLVAMVQVVARLVAPASELATEGWVRRTALDDLTGGRVAAVNKDVLYRSSDRLWQHREQIEAALGDSERRLFAAERTMVLYDLTSTYFEGLAEGNPKAQRGYSRDRRGDCKQLVVGMVLDEAGFPKASETWRGDTNDSRTLEGMLGQLERRSGGSGGATVVMDRGIASAENVALLRARGYHYVVAVSGQSRRGWIDEIRTAQFTQIDEHHQDIEGCVKDKGDERYLLVRSRSRVPKDRGIRERFLERIKEGVKKVSAALAEGRVEVAVAEQRIGRLRQRYQRASRFIVTEIIEQDGTAELRWSVDEEKLAEAELLDGVYILKTDREDLDSDRLWNLYMMLSRVESSFRYLKSSLGMRPIFHHREVRSDGHIFISILAYHLLHTIEQQLLAGGEHRSWPSIRAELETHRALTIRMAGADGRTHHLRVVTNATEEQKRIYRLLRLNPKPLRTKQYVVEEPGSDES